MTEFIRTIWAATQNGNAANAAATAAAAGVTMPPKPAPSSMTPIKTEPEAHMSKPIIKVEPTEMVLTPTTTQTPSTVVDEALIMADALRLDVAAVTLQVSAASGKAQRAARRDAVNARRDKRKSMCTTPTATSFIANSVTEIPSTPIAQDKSKKMKAAKAAIPMPTTSSTNPLMASASAASACNKTQKKGAASGMMSMVITPEIDPSGEERLRALEAQLENLDPDSKEAKKKRRLIRNRMSAQLHRERKKAYVGQLEDQLQQKERELQLLHEKLAAMANESSELKKKLSEVESQKKLATNRPSIPQTSVEPVKSISPVAAAVVSPAAKHVVTPPAEEFVIKKEPVALVSNDDGWEYCLNEWEDADMTDVATEDLLSDFENPFASYAPEDNDASHPQHLEIHAAKKNIAMMMAVVFSVTFFGNSAPFFNLANGSNFSSMFSAHPPKEFSQVSIASRIIASLDKTSWKDFRDITSWTKAAAATAAVDDEETDSEDEQVLATAVSPSAQSDTTDSEGSPESDVNSDSLLASAFETTDLIDEFVYPVDDPFAPALVETNWLDESNDVFAPTTTNSSDEHTDLFFKESLQPTKNKASSSLTSRLYEKLTALWQEKNQVLLTVSDRQNTVTKRSIADMSTIRKRMENGKWMTTTTSQDTSTAPLAEDQSVTFLYPLSAFSSTPQVIDSPSDQVFLEVSCQLNALKLS